MRILYGVQGTGQGHISRARAMAKAFENLPVEITWLFSGRDENQFYDMEPFGDCRYYRGLSFSSGGGKVSYLDTARQLNIPYLLMEALSVDVASYDLVITDFEPVSAWAARLSKVKSIGIGHQYAFGQDVPTIGDTSLTRFIMKNFAPVDFGIGLHWHPYSNTILPPILDLPTFNESTSDHYLVYLPFEDQCEVTRWLQQMPEYRFIQYSPELTDGMADNVSLRKASILDFKRQLWRSKGVICNSGFELISECLQLGKPVLTKPLLNQVEQLSNALALEQLGYASVMYSLDKAQAKHWLATAFQSQSVNYPDVADTLATWISSGMQEDITDLATALWMPSKQKLSGQTESSWSKVA
jgi:uncharacterized protein (TIGR00661 family)